MVLPVKAGIVERLQEYAWSSDRHYRRGKGLKWLDVIGYSRCSDEGGPRRFEGIDG